jgi:two-component system, sensor histidine kinase and response regulator
VRLATRQAHTKAAYADLPALQGVHVLCIDNHATTRAILEAQLTAWGMRVSCVVDGITALGRLRAAHADVQPYDLAILDSQMPGMNGSELAQVIKTDPALAPIQLIMLSSVSQRSESSALQQAGIAAYLTKPVRQSSLYNCLMAMMGVVSGPTVVSPITRRQDAIQSKIHARILVVEDNVVNQKVAVRLLEKRGCRVDVAANGREAVNALIRLAYDIVLMDCQMPVMDGFAATVAIRQHEVSTGQHVPIIAMTANAMQGDRERCLAAGMDDYLSKPITAEGLYTVLAQFRPETEVPPEDTLDPPMDLAAALITADGERDLLDDMMAVLLADSPGQLAALRTALHQSDVHGLERAAHSLKGALSAVNATRAQELAQHLEACGRDGRLERALSLVQLLDTELARLATFWAQSSDTTRAPVIPL